MKRCRRVLNTLVAPNMKGGSGPFFQPGRGGCIKAPGNFRALAGPVTFEGDQVTHNSEDVVHTGTV